MDNTPEQTSRGLGCLRKRIAEEPIALVAFLFSLLVTFVFCWHTIISFDYWWHLHTGNLILDTGTVPKTNLFSFSSPDSQWIDSHWLFQAVLAVAFRLGGHTGSLILQTLIYYFVLGKIIIITMNSINPFIQGGMIKITLI